MKASRVLMAVVALLALSFQARAQAVFSFSYAGSKTHIYDAWECPFLMCAEPTTTFGWAGTFSVLTDSGADGDYTWDHLRVALDGKILSAFQDGLGVPLHATVTGGLLVGLSGSFLAGVLEPSRFSVDGVRFTVSEPGGHHYGPTFGNAVLAPIPEPETYATVLAGLIAIGRLSRRRPGARSRSDKDWRLHRG